MGAAADDEWSIPPSDDELLADCMDPSSKYFTPKDPDEITRLYKLVAENGTIDLVWKNPGRIETKKGDTKDENVTSKDEEDHKEDLNEFDFDEPTPAVSLSFRKQKQAKAPAPRKVASFDKIMNDITKGGKGIKKESSKSDKKRKLRLAKAIKQNPASVSIKLEKIKLETEEVQSQEQSSQGAQPPQQQPPQSQPPQQQPPQQQQQQPLQQQQQPQGMPLQQQVQNPQTNQQQMHPLQMQQVQQRQQQQQQPQHQQSQQMHPQQFQHQQQFAQAQQQQQHHQQNIQQHQQQQQQQQQVHHLQQQQQQLTPSQQQQPLMQQNLLKQMLVPSGHDSQMPGQQQSQTINVIKQIPPQHHVKPDQQQQQVMGHQQKLSQNLPTQQQVLMGQQDQQQPQIQTVLHQGLQQQGQQQQQQQQYTLIQQQQQPQGYQQSQTGLRGGVAMRVQQSPINVQQQSQVYHGGVQGGNLVKIQGQSNSQQGQISVQHLQPGQQIQIHHLQHMDQTIQQNVPLPGPQPNLLKQMLVPGSCQDQGRQPMQRVHLQTQQQHVMTNQPQQQQMVTQPVVLQQALQLRHQGQQQYAIQVQQHGGDHDQYTQMQIGIRGQTTTMRQQQISMGRPLTQINLQQQLFHAGSGTMIRVGQPMTNR